MSFQRFIEMWTYQDDPPEQVSEAGLKIVEARFGLSLPEDYKRALLTHGLPNPRLALLEGILASGLDFHDVSEFFGPEEVIRLTEQWRGGGMPDHLVVFAGDCGGNLFCFDASPGADHGAVWLWDHQEGDESLAAVSFTAWIELFCSVEPAPEGFDP